MLGRHVTTAPSVPVFVAGTPDRYCGPSWVSHRNYVAAILRNYVAAILPQGSLVTRLAEWVHHAEGGWELVEVKYGPKAEDIGWVDLSCLAPCESASKIPESQPKTAWERLLEEGNV